MPATRSMTAPRALRSTAALRCRLPTIALGLLLCGSSTVSAEETKRVRIVHLGDSITDGYTYGQIIPQALWEAGRPAPVTICAGVASDTAELMAARLDATVLAYQPGIVTFSAGTNDCLRGVTAEAYEISLREIAKKVKARHATMILLTPCTLSVTEAVPEKDRAAVAERFAAGERRMDEYIAVIRRVAAEEGLAVAETSALMRAARQEGKQVMSADGIHPNYLGQALMARSILDAMQLKTVELPKTFTPPLFPGVIKEWKMTLAGLDDQQRPKSLDEAQARDLMPTDAWKTYRLPEPAPANAPNAEDWLEQVRRNGFAMRHEQGVGKGRILAWTALEETAPREVFVNTGIGVQTVWHNGRKIHDQGGRWTGFHAGKERIPIMLTAGKNVLIVEVEGREFFLSVTDKRIWEEDLWPGGK